MFCSKCGAKIPKNSEFCPECGNSIKEVSTVEMQEDSGTSIGWGILGFFIPMVGLILYLVWKTDRPKDSKAAGIGALVSVILGILSVVFMFFIFFAALASTI